VVPHLWWAGNGKAQFEASGLQKGEVLKLLQALPLGHLQPSQSVSRRIRQAMGIFLAQLSSPVRIHKLTHEEGDLSDKALCVFMSRG
jgi:hypothetical protein